VEQKLGHGPSQALLSKLMAAEIIFLSIEGKTKRISEKIRKNLKINTLESKLTINRMRRYGHISRMNHKRIPRSVLNMKEKGKPHRGRPRSRHVKQVKKDVTQEEGRT
jgi:hypothetical protein